jgi:hypothetical protein
MTRVAGRTCEYLYRTELTYAAGSEGDQPGFADMSVDAVEDVLGMDISVC